MKNYFYTKTNSASWQSRWVAQFILLMSLVFVSVAYPQPPLVEGGMTFDLLCKYKTVYLRDRDTGTYEAHLINIYEGELVAAVYMTEGEYAGKGVALLRYECIQHQDSLTLIYVQGKPFDLDGE